MSKELAKFQADYKKLEADIKACSPDVGKRIFEITKHAFNNAWTGEDHLNESMADARDEGVTGDKLEDFLKSKTFADALKLFDKSVAAFGVEQKKLQAFCAQAAGTLKEVNALAAAIDKDLKARKEKSKSKSDIEALRADLEKDIKGLTESTKLHDKLSKGAQSYVADFQKTVNGLLKKAPAEQASSRDQTKMPQLFVDRNIKTNFTKCTGALKDIGTLCEEAIAAAADDPKAVPALLKQAKDKLDTIKDIVKQYDDAAKKFKDDLDNSKDKAKIDTHMANMSKALAAGESKIRGTATTIKKAAA